MQPSYYCLYSLAAAESSQDGQDYSPNFFLIFHCHTPTTLTFKVQWVLLSLTLVRLCEDWRDMRGTHRLIYCASRAHLCDSTAFLYSIQTLNMESNWVQKLGAKVFKFGFAFLHICSPPNVTILQKNGNTASLMSCQRPDLAYEKRWNAVRAQIWRLFWSDSVKCCVCMVWTICCCLF